LKVTYKGSENAGYAVADIHGFRFDPASVLMKILPPLK